MRPDNPYNSNNAAPAQPGPQDLEGRLAALRTSEASFADLLSIPLKVFASRWVEFTVYALLFALTVGVSMIAAMEVLVRALTLIADPQDPEMMLPEIFTALGLYLAVLVGILLLNSLFSFIVAARGLDLCNAISTGRTASVASSLQSALGSFWFYLPGAFLILMMQVPGYMLCFLPGIAVVVFFSLFAPAVHESRSVFDSLGKSARLVSQRFFIVLGVLAVIYAVYYGVNMLTSIPMQLMWMDDMEAMADPSGTGNPVESLQNLFQSPAVVFGYALQGLCMGFYNIIFAIATAVMYFNFSRPVADRPLFDVQGETQNPYLQ